mmetsp:Transcript_18166/g.16456  ORF Transcript_18166/g.16456 Transcript_18166/m.16456 type:complete len:375 (+) Transcript_18166:51-1175(+)
MGGGMSSAKPKAKSSVQDEAKSFVSKIGALKVLMRKQSSRDAFITFLKDCKDYTSVIFIDFYMDIEEIHRINMNQLQVRSKVLVDKYKEKVKDKLLSHGARQILGSLGSLAKVDDWESMKIQEILNVFSKSQTEVFGSLVGEFEKFVHSDAYLKWQKDEQVNEKGRLVRENSKGVTRAPSCSAAYPTVLIADDSSVTAKIASYSLQNDGHKCFTSRNGIDALEQLKSKIFDIALVDMNLPEMNGNELVTQFREYEKDCLNKAKATMSTSSLMGITRGTGSSNNIPSTGSSKAGSFKDAKPMRTKKMIIVGMSVSDDEVTKNLALESGMDGFFHKPFSLFQFLETMNQIIEKEKEVVTTTDVATTILDGAQPKSS